MKAKYSFDNAKSNVISSKQAYSVTGEARSANVSTNMISSGSNDAYDMGPNNKRNKNIPSSNFLQQMQGPGSSQTTSQFPQSNNNNKSLNKKHQHGSNKQQEMATMGQNKKYAQNKRQVSKKNTQEVLENGNHYRRKMPTEAGDKTRETSNSSQDIILNRGFNRYDSGENGKNDDESESVVDSQEAKQIVGKPKEQLKFRNALKEKLKVTKIPNLILKPAEGEPISFNQIYKFQNFLGTGTFGFVVSAVEKSTNETIALKIVDANQKTMHSLEKEAEILQNLPPNDNVIQFKFINTYTNYVIMGMEYAQGGTLMDLQKAYTHSRKHMKDEDCSKVIKGILLGLKHLHRNDYVHRDLKPSNVVINDTDQLECCKLVDFGLAVKYQTRQGMDETCGTLVYQAPEQMAGGQCYGKAVDVWAAGFIMYEMIAGKHPLWQKNDTNEAYRAKALNYKRLKYGRRFNKFSQGLVEKLCHPKPSLRYTVDQALQHPWITRNFSDEIPRNHFEQNMYLNDIDDKMRKVWNLVFTLSVMKNYDLVQNKHSRMQIQKENTAQPTPNDKMTLKSSKGGNSLYKIKSSDDIKSGIQIGQNQAATQQEDMEPHSPVTDESFNRQTTPFFHQNSKSKARDISAGNKNLSTSQPTEASKFEAMEAIDSYLMSHLEENSPKINLKMFNEPASSPKFNGAEKAIVESSKKSEILMNSSLDNQSIGNVAKSDFTEMGRKRSNTDNYPNIINCFTDNKKQKVQDSLIIQKEEDQEKKSRAGSKHSTPRSIESFNNPKKHSTSVDIAQQKKDPLPGVSDSKANPKHGQSTQSKEVNRTQRSFRIGKFQINKSHSKKHGNGIDSSDKSFQGVSQNNEFNRKLVTQDEIQSPTKSANNGKKGNSLGGSNMKINISSPKTKQSANGRNNGQVPQANTHEYKNQQQSTEENHSALRESNASKNSINQFHRKLVSSNIPANNKLQLKIKKSKTTTEEKIAEEDQNIDQSSKEAKQENILKDILKETRSETDQFNTGDGGGGTATSASAMPEQLTLKRTGDGQYTPVKVNMRDGRKKKVVQTSTKKDKGSKNQNRVRVQAQIKRMSAKQQPQLPVAKQNTGPSNIQSQGSQSELKGIMDGDSSRTQSTPILRTNDNSQLDDAQDSKSINDTIKNNEASVKFKRKLTKGSMCNPAHESNNPSSKPVSPSIVFPPTPGLSKSELRQSAGGEKDRSEMLQQPSNSTLMKNRSSSYVDKNKNQQFGSQNQYMPQMAQTSGQMHQSKIQQMKSEIIQNQHKFRASAHNNNQIPKLSQNKAMAPQQKANLPYVGAGSYEIIRHEAPTVPTGLRQNEIMNNSYMSSMPIRGLERFNHISQPYAFKENGELKDNALNQYVQYQQFKVGAAHKGSGVIGSSSRISSSKVNQILGAGAPGSVYTAVQSQHSSNNVTQMMKSQTPVPQPNQKMNGVMQLSEQHTVSGMAPNIKQNHFNINDDKKKYVKANTVGAKLGKQDSNNDFSPFENFLLNLLQKNNEDHNISSNQQNLPSVQVNQHQQYTNASQGPSAAQTASALSKQHNTHCESRNSSSQPLDRSNPAANRSAQNTLIANKGTKNGISNINFKF